jgi:glycosyltransferase involved in cell wall biosynthesis
MRILGITNSYPPLAGGGYGEICADVMGGLARRGHEVAALTAGAAFDPAAKEAATEIDGVAVRRELDYVLAAWRHPLRARAAERHDAAILRRELARGLDAALVWHLRGVVKPPLRLLHEAGVPVLYMLHDRWVLYERPGSVFVPWARAEPLAVRALREPPIAADGIVCFNSEWLRDEHAGLGWRPRVSHVVPCGLPAAMLERAGVAAPRRDARRLLFAGRVDPSKGVHDAVSALGLLPVDVSLSIAGYASEPGYVERLRAQADEWGLTDRIRWLGALTRDELVDAFADHDVLVYPSREPESFGLGVLEAQANGLIAVTSARGGPLEFLRDGENCLIHEPGDEAGLAAAVRQLLESPGLAERLSGRGVETAAAMPVAAAVDRVEDLLRSSAGEPA